jgi:hypothetical protein
MNDPFLESDPRWQRYDRPQDVDEDFSMRDLTPKTIKDFLRSEEGQHEFEKIVPPQPQPVPAPTLGRVLGHIPGFPS